MNLGSEFCPLKIGQIENRDEGRAVCFLGHRGPTGGLLLPQCFSGRDLQVSPRVVTVESSSLLHHSLFIDCNCCL